MINQPSRRSPTDLLLDNLEIGVSDLFGVKKVCRAHPEVCAKNGGNWSEHNGVRAHEGDKGPG